MASDYGGRIRQHREKAGMDQKQLALALRVSLKHVQDWESGAAFPTLMQVPMLCCVLSMSYECFFGVDRRSVRRKKRAPDGCWQCSLLPAMYRYVIREGRAKKHLPQTEFARQAGASPQLAEKWEHGKAIPRLDEVPRICDALGIRLWQFFE